MGCALPNLREIAAGVRLRYPDDTDCVELEQMATEICACARDMVDAIDVATREDNIYMSMVANLSDRGEDGEPLDDEQIRDAADAAESQGEIAVIAARQAEAFGRELAMKVLRDADV